MWFYGDFITIIGAKIMKSLYLVFAYLFLVASADAMILNTDEPRTIVADKIEYDVRSETMKTVGNTEITNESGQRLTLTDSYITSGNINRM